jgi:hypothetical protein
MKKIELVAVVAIVGAVAAYWNYRVHQRTQHLTLIAAPFQEACQAVTGCVGDPAGWQKATDSAGGSAYYKNGEALDMVYTATQTDFKISWHIGTDVYLNATGGKGKQLDIVREVK